MTEEIWKTYHGDLPIVATALHAGHHARDEVMDRFALADHERLREEDPYKDLWTDIVPTRVIGLRSRFQVDLNRPREKAVYRKPEDAWGLRVWKDAISDEVAERSLSEYDAFYQSLRELYRKKAEQHGAFVVYDLHTYNHRRDGPDGPEADPVENPQVNIGTGTMRNRERFAGIIERFIEDLSSFEFPGGKLDVRENVKFFGGEHARWGHEHFEDSACVLSIEFKKFFMCEWSGEPDHALLAAIREALKSTVPGVLNELSRMQGQGDK